MRENRTYGSEGGEGNLPDPYSRTAPACPAIDQTEPPVMDSGFRRNDARCGAGTEGPASLNSQFPFGMNCQNHNNRLED